MNLVSKRSLLSPNPLLHKSVEEREKSDWFD
jgi:hypothetical protein